MGNICALGDLDPEGFKIVFGVNDGKPILVKQRTWEIGDRPIEIAPRTVECLLAGNSEFL